MSPRARSCPNRSCPAWFCPSCCSPLLAVAGDFPRSLDAYPGKTPTLDGVLSSGEWDDAVRFTNQGWIPQFTPTRYARGPLRSKAG